MQVQLLCEFFVLTPHKHNQLMRKCIGFGMRSANTMLEYTDSGAILFPGRPFLRWLCNRCSASRTLCKIISSKVGLSLEQHQCRSCICRILLPQLQCMMDFMTGSKHACQLHDSRPHGRCFLSGQDAHVKLREGKRVLMPGQAAKDPCFRMMVLATLTG